MHEPDTTEAQSDPKPPERTTPLQKALAQHLKRLAAVPLSPRSLLELEGTAGLARQMLALAKDPRATVRRRRLHGGIGEDDLSFEEMGSFGVGQLVLPNPTPVSGKAETFGATILREMIGALRSYAESASKSSPAELILAIDLAEKRGMANVADALRTKLLGALGADGGNGAGAPRPTTVEAVAPKTLPLLSDVLEGQAAARAADVACDGIIGRSDGITTESAEKTS